jgi:chorismate--pyruvate lyase
MTAGRSIEVRRCGWTGHLPFDVALTANLRRWVTGEGSLTAVYGHTVVVPDRYRRDWPFLNRLGERPLGGVLFTDPRVRRDPFAFARLFDHHPLRQRLQRALRMASGGNTRSDMVSTAPGSTRPFLASSPSPVLRLPSLAPLPLPRMLPARRSVFRREAGVMLVTEVFLPDLLARAAPQGVPAMPKRAPRTG